MKKNIILYQLEFFAYDINFDELNKKKLLSDVFSLFEEYNVNVFHGSIREVKK